MEKTRDSGTSPALLNRSAVAPGGIAPSLTDAGGKFVHWAAEHVCLSVTALRQPQLINHLSTLWPNFGSMLVELDRCLGADRSIDEGASPAVLAELATLRQYCAARLGRR